MFLQVAALQARLSTAEQRASEASAAAEQGTGAAHKAESDLRDLSAAYNTLEVKPLGYARMRSQSCISQIQCREEH